MARVDQTGDLRVDQIMPAICPSWVLIPFEECLQDNNGRFKKLKKKEIKPNGRIPVVDQGESFISGYIDHETDAYSGSLPVIIFGDHTRRIKFVEFPFAVGADGTKILKPIEVLKPKFFYYYLGCLNLESQGYSRHYRFLKQIKVPIPSPAEQRRIVAKLEKLLAKVDACKERLEKIPAILKRFRQSVLAAACSGRLTEDFRNGPTKWVDTILEDVILEMSNGFSKRCGSHGEEITVLRLADFSDSKRGYGKERKIRLTKKEQEKYTLDDGDILVVRVNGSREIAGRFILFEGNNEAYCDHFIRIKADVDRIQSKFFTYAMETNSARVFIENSLVTSAGQNTINQKALCAIPLCLPPLHEQHEIVRRVEALFKIADDIEHRSEKAWAHVDKLTQSILAKAFRGELVPQDPNDEPASELLKRIQDERKQQAAVGRPGRRGSKLTES